MVPEEFCPAPSRRSGCLVVLSRRSHHSPSTIKPPSSLGLFASGRLRAVDGQPDFKAGLATAGFKFNFATMPVANDAVADDQPKAGAGADGFCGEKRFEHVRLHLRRNARA